MPGYWRAHGRAKRTSTLLLWVYCIYLQALYWISSSAVLYTIRFFRLYFGYHGDEVCEASRREPTYMKDQFGSTEVSVRVHVMWNSFRWRISYSIIFHEHYFIEKTAPSTLLSYSIFWLTAFSTYYSSLRALRFGQRLNSFHPSYLHPKSFSDPNPNILLCYMHSVYCERLKSFLSLWSDPAPR